MCANVGALRVFNNMPVCDVPWSAMIMEYVLMSQGQQGLGLV
jgi:hypothetical protein